MYITPSLKKSKYYGQHFKVLEVIDGNWIIQVGEYKIQVGRTFWEEVSELDGQEL